MPLKEGNRTALVGIGVMAGVLQVIVGVAMYLAGVYFKPWSMLVTGVVLFLCIVVGTRWYSIKYLNDEISYKQALIVGVVIAVSTGAVYAVYNLVSINFFYSGFLRIDFRRNGSVLVWISLCYLCVLCVSVVNKASFLAHHRDTESTEVAQRRISN